MKKNYTRIFFRYVFEFAAAGFAGWIYEVATVWIMYRYYDNRGMLHLPVIPIYSVGAFILLVLLRKKRNPLFIFFFAMAVTTVFELGASYLLEFIFHEQFWTYENWYFSILDRSSLISSAIFGIMAVAYFYGLHPLSGKLSEKLPEPVCLGTGVFMAGAIITDIVISFSEHLSK
ncbi:putative ABC transporter permease [Ruminococcus flavefaciens]|uniref:putative ABC transporter permease n=1 Tax=Ruminococcus flavefaciens TaxID=1265 RepID=UPI0026EB2CB5|nr:putative ABC transporter permease [Ruminococcus flavefaciens]